MTFGAATTSNGVRRCVAMCRGPLAREIEPLTGPQAKPVDRRPLSMNVLAVLGNRPGSLVNLPATLASLPALLASLHDSLASAPGSLTRERIGSGHAPAKLSPAPAHAPESAPAPAC